MTEVSPDQDAERPNPATVRPAKRAAGDSLASLRIERPERTVANTAR
jgi:hypothetical protein